MHNTTTTTKIAIASILIILVALVLYAATKSDGVTNTDGTASSTVSTSTTSGANSSKNGSAAVKSGQIVTVTPKQNPLAGTSWVWKDTSFMNKATTVTPGNSKFVIIFGTDGAVTSSTDCNSVAGRYAVNNDKINIAALTSTLMACAAPTLEAEYVKQLSQVSNFTFESLNELDLTVSNGSATMSFSRRP